MTTPIAPAAAERLDAAVSALASLEAQTGGLALAAIEKKPGADRDLTNHRARLRDAEAVVAELRLALRLGEQRDARAEVEQRYQQRLGDLTELEQVGKAKQRAVEVYCRAVEIAAKAYLDILDTSLQMEGWIPSGTDLQRYGLSPHSAEALILDGLGNATSVPTSTETIAAAEMQRHARITRVGNSGALPGARALSPTVMQNPDAVEPWPSSNQRLTATIVAHLKGQIDDLHQRELDAIEAPQVQKVT